MKASSTEKTTARGEATRRKLLDAARQLFSEKGFAAVSTRDITRAAGATLPAIPHHFGSKEGLYQAVLLELAEAMRQGLTGPAAAAVSLLAQQPSRVQILAALENLLSTYARAILNSQSEFAPLMVQEQAHPSQASAPVNEVLDAYLMAPLQGLVARLRGLPADDPAVTLLAFFLVGRILIFRTVNAAALRLLHWPEITPSHLETIVELLRVEIRVLFAE